MKKLFIVVLCAILFGCKKDKADNFSDITLTEYAPVAVSKSVTKKVFVHVMPWFETPETNVPLGAWGVHWRMANRDPNVIADGKRQIASYYYPLIGPYASGDKDVIEYQLLLMKLSGIDGVFIDWPGLRNVTDYILNARNSESMIAQLKKVGLNYAIVYEDQNLKPILDRVGQAKTDISYLESRHFTKSNYEKINSKPLLMVFGPQALLDEASWTDVFSVLTQKPAFFPLLYQSNKAGVNATGEFAWVGSGNTSALTNFYNNGYAGLKITAAYPGFKDFYAAGGWPGALGWTIDHNGTNTFNTTVDLALATSNNYLQLVTWNDYGEGTMIEPTKEFGYSFLTSLQQKLGASAMSQAKLEMVKRLFDLRKDKANNADAQKALDQIFYYMVSLQFDKAQELLNRF
ncbi:hypothetical protein LK994_10620 [Ferruginibacter lapsinanis]|uniref:glycoside hydrolase family 71/99-like protein n=1 Tax=Ferruginibacter lapsinanis TaxID=563172 RepID=UPI001E293613|nr:glycoside hydrolase family 71/99-like protein [Ferruginibacter lapsinanis]UEG49083.1 hypothetical protein LK994_10620 [Ferruginibacter lapsinanis]